MKTKTDAVSGIQSPINKCVFFFFFFSMSVWTWIQASLWLSMFVSEAWSDNNPGELLNLTPVQSNNSSKRELELDPAHYLRSKPLNPPKRKQTVSQNSHIWARVSETHNYSSIARGENVGYALCEAKKQQNPSKIKAVTFGVRIFPRLVFLCVCARVCWGSSSLATSLLNRQSLRSVSKSDTKANLPLASKRPFH